MIITLEQFYRSMRGLTKPNAERYYPYFIEAIEEFKIIEPLQLAHFIGQIAHESGYLKYWQEIWGPTRAQRKYHSRADLGNTTEEARAFALAAGVEDVGFFYCGRGVLQTTGYFNYARVAAALKIPCDSNPFMLANPAYGFRSSALFWSDNNLNRIAIRDSVEAVTRVINGGKNGLVDRVAKTAYAKQALGLPVG